MSELNKSAINQLKHNLVRNGYLPNIDLMIKNEHYHSPSMGCVLDDDYIQRGGRKMFCKKCIIHDVKCCRCGWEFGWHGGKNIKWK